MKINFDGMRRNMTFRMNVLQNDIKCLIDDGHIYRSEDKRIVEHFNDVARMVDMLNMLSAKDGSYNALEMDVYMLNEEEEDER